MTTYPISIDSAGGEYMESVLVVSWAAKPGDPVKAGQFVVTVETAKAATDVEADRDGWLVEVFFDEGQEAPVGAVLGTISDTEPLLHTPQHPAASAAVEIRERAITAVDTPALDSSALASVRRNPARVIASPLARRIARETGIDLATISATSPSGRIKQRDVLAALASPKTLSNRIGEGPSPPTSMLPAPTLLSPLRQPVPLVLLHGFGADRSAWRQILPLLPPEIKAISLDLPGHGGGTLRTVQDIEDIAFDLSDQLEARGIECAHLVGHSLGGAAALSLAVLGRIEVRSLTLLAPGGLGPEINADFIAGLTQSTTPEALDRWLTLMVGNPAALPHGYARAVWRQMDKVGNRNELIRLAERLFPNGAQGFDVRPALQGLSVPTRIIWGRADRVIPNTHISHAPGFAAIHLLDGVGHVPQMEAPVLTARLIMETLRSAF